MVFGSRNTIREVSMQISVSIVFALFSFILVNAGDKRAELAAPVGNRVKKMKLPISVVESGVMGDGGSVNIVLKDSAKKFFSFTVDLRWDTKTKGEVYIFNHAKLENKLNTSELSLLKRTLDCWLAAPKNKNKWAKRDVLLVNKYIGLLLKKPEVKKKPKRKVDKPTDKGE